jgi:hypothetical protein
MIVRISSRRSRGLYGLARYALAPACIAFSPSPLSANEVTTMIGTWAVAGSERIARVASRPDSFGSWTSMRTRSGTSRRAVATPSGPSTASISR